MGDHPIDLAQTPQDRGCNQPGKCAVARLERRQILGAGQCLIKWATPVQDIMDQIGRACPGVQSRGGIQIFIHSFRGIRDLERLVTKLVGMDQQTIYKIYFPIRGNYSWQNRSCHMKLAP